MDFQHTPVMLKEVLEYLRPKSGGYFIDGTLGGGGYTSALAQVAGASGKVLAIDLDKQAIANTAEKKLANVILVNDNFANLAEIIAAKFEAGRLFDGFVLDLGLSSFQLADIRRGFSFREDSPLDMSFGSSGDNQRAKEIVNSYREEDLAKIFFQYGEEKHARRIAKGIVERRKLKRIETTGDLVEIIKKAIPRRLWSEKIHPATKTFQALRLAVNRELENLEKVLPQAVTALKSGGRIAIISFHSLEDRIVKDFFKIESRACLCPPEIPLCRCGHSALLKIVTKKPLTPTEEEIKINPRGRSAKMRVAEKI
ncbi:MAG TPA: 16S rRNA (cytosine(1402)-N(4))-methyltransferase RsmH [Candidatus Nanoarchaeia archaeon]|nr:16S rRNA (cytosine(1402)-N(4))-methyltransferase RsmH [Candidatus Nanoarchaeia archaeon]